MTDLTFGPVEAEAGRAFWEHAFHSFLPAFAALAAGIPMAWLLSRAPAAVSAARTFLRVLYSLPMLGLMGAVVGAAAPETWGVHVLLLVYTLMPIACCGAEGIRRIDPVVLEACRGMGLSESRLFFLAKLPPSASGFLEGFRLAVLGAVALFALTGIAGREGLGALVVEGLQKEDPALALGGGALLCVLALGSDQVLKLVRFAFTRNVNVESEASLPGAPAGEARFF